VTIRRDFPFLRGIKTAFSRPTSARRRSSLETVPVRIQRDHRGAAAYERFLAFALIPAISEQPPAGRIPHPEAKLEIVSARVLPGRSRTARRPKKRCHAALSSISPDLIPQHEEREEVSERWIPILSAIVGLVGGIGGAAIGGQIANEGQAQLRQDERTAELNNLLIDTYSRYLRTAASAQIAHTGGELSQAEANRIGGELEAGAAEVSLVTNSDQVEDAADRLEEAVIAQVGMGGYRRARDRFIEAADASFAREEDLIKADRRHPAISKPPQELPR
jgi:hypothetical protein